MSRPWVRLQASIIGSDVGLMLKTENEMKMKFPLADIISVHKVHDYREDVESYKDMLIKYKLLPCNYLMQRLAILWNGEVTFCCMDYNNNYELGNVEEQTIREIWLSKKMDKYRRIHSIGMRKKISMCRNCLVNILPISDKEREPEKLINYLDCERNDILSGKD
jgi:radical SAM protein with 4Fe4S-binding SPASM domain